MTASSLARADPLALQRCALVFGEVSDVVGQAARSAGDSARVTWTGGPGQDYQRRLSVLVSAMLQVQRAYASASLALREYAAALATASELAQRGEALLAQSQQLDLQVLLLGLPDAPESQSASQHSAEARSLGERLLQEAADSEQVAALLLQATLQDLVARVPHVPRGTGSERFVAQGASALGASLLSTPLLLRDGVEALPGVGDEAGREAARARLESQAEALEHPVLTVERMLQQLGDGHAGNVAGALAGIALSRKLQLARSEEFFGTGKRMEAGVLLATRFGAELSEGVGVAQAAFAMELERLRALPLPDVETLVSGGVDLLHHEAHGSHGVLKHVGRTAEWLRERQRFEGATDPRSSFYSVAVAERVVARALAEHADEVRAILGGGSLKLTVPLSADVAAGLVVGASGEAVAARELVLIFRREAGTLRINTAYVDP